MSLYRLLVVVTFCCLSIAFAEDRPSSKQNAFAKARPRESSVVNNKNQKDATHATIEALLDKQRNGISGSAPTCYAMRTYVAHTNLDREFVMNAGPEAVSYDPSTPGSRETVTLSEPYATCTPSLRFDVRTTLQTAEAGDNRK